MEIRKVLNNNSVLVGEGTKIISGSARVSVIKENRVRKQMRKKLTEFLFYKKNLLRD